MVNKDLTKRSKGGNDNGDSNPPGSKTGMGVDEITGNANAYALLIGVGDCEYKKWSLPVSRIDVLALEDTLANPRYCAYPPEDIHVVTDEKATHAGILEALDDMAKKSREDAEATFLIYYSGHGWRLRSEEEDQFFLIPHDVVPHDIAGSAIPASSFVERLKDVDGQRVLILMDTCHASGMAKEAMFSDALSPEEFQQEPLPKALAEELSSGEGRAVFLSCRETQKSWILPGEGALSIFTHHLLEGLRGQGLSNGYRYVTLGSLMGHLSETVPESAKKIGEEQTPFFRFETEGFAVALNQTDGKDSAQDNTDGSKMAGDKTGGDKTGGDKTGGDKTGGDKTGGDKTGGDKITGDGDKITGDKITGDGDKITGDKITGDGDKITGDNNKNSDDHSTTINVGSVSSGRDTQIADKIHNVRTNDGP